MPRNCFRLERIRQSVLSCHIRRIARYHIKYFFSKLLRCRLHISPENLNFIFQMIIPHTPLRHLGAVFLNFQPGKMLSVCLCFQKNRYNSRSCTEVHRTLPAFHLCVGGQQHCIDSVAEKGWILYHPVTVLQIIEPLSRLQKFFSVFHKSFLFFCSGEKSLRRCRSSHLLSFSHAKW